MNETEWNLQREVLQLRMALCEAQSQVLQANHTRAKEQLDALGDKWEAPSDEPLPRRNGADKRIRVDEAAAKQ